ncbi:MAG: type II toxin-antitoxin system RelE/ParE family toxin [Parcubacteria group bacterium]
MKPPNVANACLPNLAREGSLDRAGDADLDRIVVHVAQDSVVAALRLQDRIIESVQRLAQHPRRGRRGSVAGTHELVVVGTPYVAVYRVTEIVEVLRVRHGRLHGLVRFVISAIMLRQSTVHAFCAHGCCARNRLSVENLACAAR